jgi:hypothetical protein
MSKSTDQNQETSRAIEQRIWEQREGEKAHLYAAFKLYLSLPVPRSASKVAAEIGQPARTVDRWRTDNDWIKRAAAWDQYQLSQSIEAAALKYNNFENPYEAALQMQVKRAQMLSETAADLLNSAAGRMKWAQKMYQREVDTVRAKKGDWEAIEPPVPSPNIVSCIRGCSDVMAKCAEAEALALGITDVLAMQNQAGGNS